MYGCCTQGRDDGRQRGEIVQLSTFLVIVSDAGTHLGTELHLRLLLQQSV